MRSCLTFSVSTMRFRSCCSGEGRIITSLSSLSIIFCFTACGRFDGIPVLFAAHICPGTMASSRPLPSLLPFSRAFCRFFSFLFSASIASHSSKVSSGRGGSIALRRSFSFPHHSCFLASFEVTHSSNVTSGSPSAFLFSCSLVQMAFCRVSLAAFRSSSVISLAASSSSSSSSSASIVPSVRSSWPPNSAAAASAAASSSCCAANFSASASRGGFSTPNNPCPVEEAATAAACATLCASAATAAAAASSAFFCASFSARSAAAM
mmetsp:Transcript_15847/g.21355  ORF Transcript_15847/g.21355 Transcript_15847/m.21355 type:complete len:265 (+) Transcript_15847:1033-1827(+)